MTREEAIRQLKEQIMPRAPIASIEAVETAIKALEKEKEPAPSANDASLMPIQKDNFLNKDTSEKTKCQEAISDAVDNMIAIHNTLTPEERRIWELGETFRRILDIQRLIEVNDEENT